MEPIKTKVVVDDYVYEVTTYKKSGETNAQWIARHQAAVQAVIEIHNDAYSISVCVLAVKALSPEVETTWDGEESFADLADRHATEILAVL